MDQIICFILDLEKFIQGRQDSELHHQTSFDTTTYLALDLTHCYEYYLNKMIDCKRRSFKSHAKWVIWPFICSSCPKHLLPNWPHLPIAMKFLTIFTILLVFNVIPFGNFRYIRVRSPYIRVSECCCKFETRIILIDIK